MLKNIWYIHPYAGGPGVGRYVRPYALAKHWSERGIRATVFTAANHHQLDAPRTAGPAMVEGIEYEFISCLAYSGNSLSRLINMAEVTINLWRRGEHYKEQYGKPDAIICSSPHPYIFLASHSLARRFGAMSIFEVRDLWPLSFVELLGTHPHHPLVLLTGRLEQYAYKNASAVISLLPLTKPYMMKHGLAGHKWHYIPNGIEPERQTAAHAVEPMTACLEKARLLRAQGKTIIAYTGGLGRPNNVESLIQALAIYPPEERHKLAAIIVGKGEMQADLDRLIHRLGLEDTAFIFDQVPKQTALALLDSVDIGFIALKSAPLFNFGISPNKMFDYMLAALPILSSINAGNDPVAETQCGISVPSGKPSEIATALHKLVSAKPTERRAMGLRAQQYVLQNHSYESLANRYLEAITTP